MTEDTSMSFTQVKVFAVCYFKKHTEVMAMEELINVLFIMTFRLAQRLFLLYSAPINVQSQLIQYHIRVRHATW